MSEAAAELERIRSGGKRAVSLALSALDISPRLPATSALLDAALADPHGKVIGLTGPPGVGKSTLTNALIATLRTQGRTAGVIAVDPSSKRSGGALLGDRTRLKTDPGDRGLFMRSLAARDRLGGLSETALASIVLMRALFDVVLVETVGIGQSEGDVEMIADTIVLCLQPASGDSLQFMKAGIMEVPDIVVVTKADLGAPARRAAADAEGALGLSSTGNAPPVHLVSSVTGQGIDALSEAVLQHEAGDDRRSGLARRLLEDALRTRFGREGFAALSAAISGPVESPFGLMEDFSRRIIAAFPR